jgi:hypothetical protein
MLGYILGIGLGIGLLISSLYFYKNTIIYNFLLYYDIFINYQTKNITYTGINNQNIINTNNLDDIKNYDIKIVNFNINNKTKRKIYTNDIDFSLLNNLPTYNSEIILATIDLFDINNQLIIKDIDITNEFNEFILYNTNIRVANSKLDKLLWISVINNKFNYDYSKELNINYNLMKDDISTINGEILNIVVKDGKLVLSVESQL